MPSAISSCVSWSNSASEPSHQWTRSGLVSAAISRTQATSFACSRRRGFETGNAGGPRRRRLGLHDDRFCHAHVDLIPQLPPARRRTDLSHPITPPGIPKGQRARRRPDLIDFRAARPCAIEAPLAECRSANSPASEKSGAPDRAFKASPANPLIATSPLQPPPLGAVRRQGERLLPNYPAEQTSSSSEILAPCVAAPQHRLTAWDHLTGRAQTGTGQTSAIPDHISAITRTTAESFSACCDAASAQLQKSGASLCGQVAYWHSLTPVTVRISGADSEPAGFCSCAILGRELPRRLVRQAGDKDGQAVRSQLVELVAVVIVPVARVEAVLRASRFVPKMLSTPRAASADHRSGRGSTLPVQASRRSGFTPRAISSSSCAIEFTVSRDHQFGRQLVDLDGLLVCIRDDETRCSRPSPRAPRRSSAGRWPPASCRARGSHCSSPPSPVPPPASAG